jgi:hypothetical protein
VAKNSVKISEKKFAFPEVLCCQQQKAPEISLWRERDLRPVGESFNQLITGVGGLPPLRV